MNADKSKERRLTAKSRFCTSPRVRPRVQIYPYDQEEDGPNAATTTSTVRSRPREHGL